jgi:membrane-associated phospholipid phosphatase
LDYKYAIAIIAALMFYTLKVLKQKPSKLTKQTAKQYLLYILCALGVYAAAASIAASGNLGSIEQDIFTWIYNLPHIPSVLILAITQLGSAWFLLALIAVCIANKSRALAIRLGAAGAVTYAMVELSKNLVGRPRPEYLLDSVNPREEFVTGLGFPSGHTALITIIGLMMLPYFPIKLRWLVPVIIALVGFSRIYLGVHAPLDVIGGLAVGAVVSLSYYLGSNLARHKRFAKVSKSA